MGIQEIREYGLSKTGTTESFPFDNHTLVLKVLTKMFLLAPLQLWDQGEDTITLKCNPEYAQELRDNYKSVTAGRYLSNKHWNAIKIYNGELSSELIKQLIDHSYDKVIQGMTKKMQKQLGV